MARLAQTKTPVLLLKTKSVPTDAYEALFETLDNARYAPAFVPVLEHRFKGNVLARVQSEITNRGLVPASQNGRATYGALIFTSQRAVEAFTQIVQDIRADGALDVDDLLPSSLPLYVVGPATARGLRSLNLRCPILGEETGNGEALAAYICQHYNSIYSDTEKPPLLFLVGEKRRDIIPKTLESEELDVGKRSNVEELIIYETGDLQSFKADFSTIWHSNAESGAQSQWVVVFSPNGCQAMLESLDLVDATSGKAKPALQERSIFIATIGPTTRDYLVNEFNFTPDVCAAKPTPESIAEGIEDFMRRNG